MLSNSKRNGQMGSTRPRQDAPSASESVRAGSIAGRKTRTYPIRISKGAEHIREENGRVVIVKSGDTKVLATKHND